MENNKTNDVIKEQESKNKHKNYPFCDNKDTVVNNGVSKDVPHYDTINIYKYC